VQRGALGACQPAWNMCRISREIESGTHTSANAPKAPAVAHAVG
jgi:hypothetical protein